MRYYTVGNSYTIEEVRNILTYIHSILHRYIESVVEPNNKNHNTTYKLRVELSPKEYEILNNQGFKH